MCGWQPLPQGVPRPAPMVPGGRLLPVSPGPPASAGAGLLVFLWSPCPCFSSSSGLPLASHTARLCLPGHSPGGHRWFQRLLYGPAGGPGGRSVSCLCRSSIKKDDRAQTRTELLSSGSLRLGSLPQLVGPPGMGSWNHSSPGLAGSLLWEPPG